VGQSVIYPAASAPGLPTLVIQPRTDYYHANPAWVEFDLKGVNVDIFSTSYSSRQLLAVADTMAPSASVNTRSPRASTQTSSPSSRHCASRTPQTSH
jgi:hypothetical protein